MNVKKITISDLVARLLAGERGNLPMYLAMLLERSSRLRNSEDHYRAILPEEILSVEVSSEMAEQVISHLCNEISRNPDAAFIAAVSTTGVERVTRCITDVLIRPPRPLTTEEHAQALGIASAYLPACLSRDRRFLPEKERVYLVEQLSTLALLEDMTIKRDANRLLEVLTDGRRTDA